MRRAELFDVAEARGLVRLADGREGVLTFIRTRLARQGRGIVTTVVVGGRHEHPAPDTFTHVSVDRGATWEPLVGDCVPCPPHRWRGTSDAVAIAGPYVGKAVLVRVCDDCEVREHRPLDRTGGWRRADRAGAVVASGLHRGE